MTRIREEEVLAVD